MERDELVNALCNLFERQTYWDFNSLARSTDQPQNWLKEVLGDICIYNKRGPHKVGGNWGVW
jgi:transcription initiation factor TFIIF subunit beta